MSESTRRPAVAAVLPAHPEFDAAIALSSFFGCIGRNGLAGAHAAGQLKSGNKIFPP